MAAGASTLLAVHGALFTGIRAMMMTPTQRMRQGAKLHVAVMAHRPTPPSLTPARVWSMLGPSATPSTLRQFSRLYGATVFFHWVSFSLSLVSAAGVQAYTQGALMGDRVPQGIISERQRTRLIAEADASVREFQARAGAAKGGLGLGPEPGR